MSDEDAEHPLTDEEIQEIYAASSSMEADRVVLMLQEDGIEAMKRETSVAAFPSEAQNRYLVTVFQHDHEKAVKVIQQAVADDVLPDTGTLY